MKKEIRTLPLDVLNKYQKPHVSDQIKKELEEEAAAYEGKIIVLDDDPTGTQSVNHVPVYTDVSQSVFEEIFTNYSKTNFILTNSRAMTEAETETLHRNIGNMLRLSAKGRKFILISRGDSTLRGHFPLETEVLKESLEADGKEKYDGEIICPFFRNGGRYTLFHVHYVKDGDRLLPAAETEFAKDKTFGYVSSDLKEYVIEKSKGRIQEKDIAVIGLDEIQRHDMTGIESKLTAAENFQKLIVDAVSEDDLTIVSIALYRAIKKGKKFLFRTAADFVKNISCIRDQPIDFDELASGGDKGGLVIAGSHTEKTTRQLEQLKEEQNMIFLEMDVNDVDRLDEESGRLAKLCSEEIAKGKTPVVYTSRKLVSANEEGGEAALRCSVKISEAVQAIAAKLQEKPAYIIAKGGITSSDIATKALKIKKAWVMGQIAPGVPVWKTGQESRFPEIPYIVFPGNVGDDGTLREIVHILSERMGG